MDALSDEELQELDRLIQDTYKGVEGLKRQRVDWLMKQYFTVGRKLTPIAAVWLKDAEETVSDSRPSIIAIIENERRSIEIDAQTT